MATIEQVVTQVQTYMATLSGIRSAPSSPPDSLGGLPMAVCIPQRGRWSVGSQSKKGLHAIVIDIHISRKDAPRDYKAFVPYIESVPNLLFSELLNGKWDGLVETIGDIEYATTTFDYAGMETVGLRFTVTDIKMISAIT